MAQGSQKTVFGSSSDLSSDNSDILMSTGMPLYFEDRIDHERIRYPHCVVWTPIPCLTCLNSQSSLVNFVTRHGILSGQMNSVLGRNVINCSLRYNTSVDCIGKLEFSPHNINKYAIANQDILNTSALILELLQCRDGSYSWLFPFIGHMGICTMQGIIRDFAGPYYVSEDNMAFGNPTRYWQLDVSKVPGTNVREAWDRSVFEASEEYKGRIHNLCCDNCHSHVAYALNLMKYDGSTSWNMFKLCYMLLVHGKFVSCGGFLKTWLPFLIAASVALIVGIVTHFA